MCNKVLLDNILSYFAYNAGQCNYPSFFLPPFLKLAVIFVFFQSIGSSKLSENSLNYNIKGPAMIIPFLKNILTFIKSVT